MKWLHEELQERAALITTELPNSVCQKEVVSLKASEILALIPK